MKSKHEKSESPHQEYIEHKKLGKKMKDKTMKGAQHLMGRSFPNQDQQMLSKMGKRRGE